MKNKRKKKALILSALASLAILSGCGSVTSNKTISVNGEQYVQNGDEYVRLDSNPKVYEPGTHIIYYVFFAQNCRFLNEGYGNSEIYIPSTPEGYSVMSISDISAKGHDHTNGIIIFYVNDKKVEVTGEYNSSTGVFEYDKPGKVIEEKTLEMGN